MYTTLIIAKTRCFVNTANGTKASAILYSLAATAQANNVVFSEVTDSNFNYGNVAPDDSYNVSGTRSAKATPHNCKAVKNMV